MVKWWNPAELAAMDHLAVYGVPNTSSNVIVDRVGSVGCGAEGKRVVFGVGPAG
jgi:hypothetical protein